MNKERQYKVDVHGYKLPSGRQQEDIVTYYVDDYDMAAWGLLLVAADTQVGIPWDSVYNFQITKRGQ